MHVLLKFSLFEYEIPHKRNAKENSNPNPMDFFLKLKAKERSLEKKKSKLAFKIRKIFISKVRTFF